MKRIFAAGLAYVLAFEREGIDAEDLVGHVEEGNWSHESPEASAILKVARMFLAENSDDTQFMATPKTLNEWEEHPLHKVATELGDPKVALVMGGATSVKQYLFESSRLPEIRGGSAILDRINRVQVPQLVEGEILNCRHCVVYANGGDTLLLAPPSKAQELADAIENIYKRETITAQAVAVYRECSLLELRFGLDPDHFFRRFIFGSDARTVDALVRVGGRSCRPKDKDHWGEFKCFGQLAGELAVSFKNRREGNVVDGRPALVMEAGESFPYARRCGSCERRVAIYHHCSDEFDGVDRYLCEPCARKYLVGQKTRRAGAGRRLEKALSALWVPGEFISWEQHFRAWLHDNSLEAEYFAGFNSQEVSSPQDLEELAGADGYVAYIYADGNDLGRMLASLSTPYDYQRFASTVATSLREAVFRALFRCAKPEPGDNGQGGGVLPFEVLTVGGDDVFLIVQAKKALSLAATLGRLFEEITAHSELSELLGENSQESVTCPHRCKVELKSEQSPISLSAGILICRHSTPVFFACDIVEELLRSAKGKARVLREQYGWSGGTVDFMNLKMTPVLPRSLKYYRERVLTRNLALGLHPSGKDVKKIRMTAKPYTWPEFEVLMASASALKEIPRSRLYELRNSLAKGYRQAQLDYFYYTSRLRPEQRAVLVTDFEIPWGMEGPWLRVDDKEGGEVECVTLLADIAEVIDFLPSGSGTVMGVSGRR